MIGRAIAGLIVLCLILFILFLWMRRRRLKKDKEELEKIREHFQENFQVGEKASPEDTEILDELVEKIDETAEGGKKTVEFTIGDERDLSIEAPDLLALKTPRGNLHKTFSDIKFREIEKSGADIELHLDTD